MFNTRVFFEGKRKRLFFVFVCCASLRGAIIVVGSSNFMVSFLFSCCYRSSFLGSQYPVESPFFLLPEECTDHLSDALSNLKYPSYRSGQ